jgi:DNA-binding NarL/FixJ family response regulator
MGCRTRCASAHRERPLPTILIVDDHAAIRSSVRVLFESSMQRINISEAENGADAIEKARNSQPDLIVLDLSMPIMNGFDAAKILRRMFPATPLFLLTAHRLDATVLAARQIGFQAVFSKDADWGPLVMEARAVIEHEAATFTPQAKSA